MFTIVNDTTHHRLEATEQETMPVRRDAFYLESQGEPLFAWLHRRQEQESLDHGVIICPPIGYEQLHSQRSLRHLADAVARRGIPALRFDWHGTGDSAGIDEDANRTTTWQANLRDAVTWMRRELGCRRISIVGLRLGATIAALASTDLEIDNLVLWAPVTNGRAYVREMMAIDMTSEFRPSSESTNSGNIEAAGFTLSQATATELSQWNLLKSSPACRRTLLVMREELPEDRRLCDGYLAADIAIEQVTAPGYLEMMAEPHKSRIPERAIKQMTTWLETHIQSESTKNVIASSSFRGASDATMWHRPETSSSCDNGRQIREQAVRISAEPDLFGILSEPVAPVATDLPTIVLLNAGSCYRIGPGRLHVHIARQLSSLGFRCLRLDISGLGDSIAADLALENETYPSTVFRDVDVTLHYLLQEFGVTECILMGLCSGAYAAFQSAARLSNPLLVESMLINPLTFFWKDGMTLDASPVQHLRSQHYYLSSALQPKKWLKLLSGQTHIGFSGALRMLMQRLRPARHSSSTTSDECRGLPCGINSHPERDDLPADLASVVAAGRKISLFFATSDPGYSILMHKAKRQTNQLLRAGQLKLSFIDDADHTFSRRQARRSLIEALTAHLLACYLSKSPKEIV